MNEAGNANAILLIYYQSMGSGATALTDHVNAFSQYSQFPVISLNTEFGFDTELSRWRFPVIVLHFSLFDSGRYRLESHWEQFIAEQRQAYKIAFFQDEYEHCQQRYTFLNRHRVDCVYTCYAPACWDATYRKHTVASELVHTLTGYVNEALANKANRFARPDVQRQIDVGYRARRVPLRFGAAGYEKWQIGEVFRQRCKKVELVLDISSREKDRIYGDRWFRFLGNCKAVLGTESGSSITDLDGEVAAGCQALIEKNPQITFAEASRYLLHRYEDTLPLRTISPRCFEAAALGTCQILFRGDYAGILAADVHYIPLEKDFSNVDDVLRQLCDPALRAERVAAARRDLIDSGHYSYLGFIEAFDRRLVQKGMALCPADSQDEQLVTLFQNRQKDRRRRGWLRHGARWSLAMLPPRIGYPLRTCLQRLPGLSSRHS